jgi:hypothetical protein
MTALIGFLLLFGPGLLAAYMGSVAAGVERPQPRRLILFAAAAPPFLEAITLYVRDSIVFSRPLFDLTNVSARYGFWVSLLFATFYAPLCWLFAWAAYRQVRRSPPPR